MPSGTEGASRHGHHRHGYQHHSPRWGKRLCPSLPPLLPSGASPPGQRAEGEWGDWVGQPAQPGQREGQWLSTARSSGHAEVPQRSSGKHAMAARGRREWGHAEGLGACQQIHASRGGRCQSTMESLTDCSPATHHQMVVETKAGGSPFAASGAQPQKAE